jgi:hypothetical protein
MCFFSNSGINCTRFGRGKLLEPRGGNSWLNDEQWPVRREWESSASWPGTSSSRLTVTFWQELLIRIDSILIRIRFHKVIADPDPQQAFLLMNWKKCTKKYSFYFIFLTPPDPGSGCRTGSGSTTLPFWTFFIKAKEKPKLYLYGNRCCGTRYLSRYVWDVLVPQW